MRPTLLVLLLLVISGSVEASITGTTPDTAKDPGFPYLNPNPPIRVTGDTIGDPFVLVGPLPVTVTGTTAGFTNDYEESCPYFSTSPDVVYAYTADGTAESITLDLCYSSYDTKLFVYDNTGPPAAPYACNDDFHTAAPCYIYSSKIEMMPVMADHTYYLVVDGYGGQSGAYQLDITDGGMPPPTGACCHPSGSCSITYETGCPDAWQGENTDCEPNLCPPPQPVVCPPGALIEGEPPCADGYIDEFNSGCGGDPMVWTPINPQAGGCAVMCAKSCTFLSNEGWELRDTDWFESIGTGGPVTVTGTAEFPLQLLLIYGTDCANLLYLYGLGDPSEPVTLSWPVDAGESVWFWVGVSTFSGWPESDYVLDVCGIQNPPLPPGACCSVTGVCVVLTPEACAFWGGVFLGGECTPNVCEPVPTEDKSWGQLKNLYR